MFVYLFIYFCFPCLRGMSVKRLLRAMSANLLFRWIFLVLPNPWPNETGSITADFVGASCYVIQRVIFFYCTVLTRESLKKAWEWMSDQTIPGTYVWQQRKSQQMGRSYPTSSSCLHRVIRANVRLWSLEEVFQTSLRNHHFLGLCYFDYFPGLSDMYAYPHVIYPWCPFWWSGLC